VTSHVYSKQHFLYFVVDDATVGPADPVKGSVHVRGRRQESVASVKDIVVVRRISKVEPGCHIVDLKMLLLSLEFPELDDIPVLRQVEAVDNDNDSITISFLLSHGTSPYDYWPEISSVPSFVQNKPLPLT
jgi:hypothetical protein